MASYFHKIDKFSGMELRHKCCQAIYRALTSSSKLISDPALADIAAKVRMCVVYSYSFHLILAARHCHFSY